MCIILHAPPYFLGEPPSGRRLVGAVGDSTPKQRHPVIYLDSPKNIVPFNLVMDLHQNAAQRKQRKLGRAIIN